MPLNQEQRSSIRNFGCFKFINSKVRDKTENCIILEDLRKDKDEQNEPIFFKVNSKYQMGKRILANRYKLWKENANDYFKENIISVYELAKSISPIECVKSFFKTMSNKKHEQRFLLSIKLFSRYDKFCDFQKLIFKNFKEGIKERITSFKEYNQRKHQEFIQNLDKMSNKIVLIPIGISHFIAKIKFYSKKLIVNIFMIGWKLFCTLCSLLWLFIKTCYNILMFCGSIILRLIWNLIVHIIILVMFLISCITLVFIVAFWSIIRFFGFSIKIFLKIYYFLMYGFIRLLDRLPETINTDDIEKDMYYTHNKGKTFRQLIIIDENMYNDLINTP